MSGAITGFFSGTVGILYLLLGFVQMAAIVGGIHSGTGIPIILALPIAFFIAEIPVVGTVAGIYGAMANWGVSLPGAIALFGLPFIIITIMALASARE